ncbi:MAG: 23S rRNA (pseudouridine(1915)-N(3))-methyltransferase RlmH [Desulfovermiculus sp.]|nr:23S rRNA (pseudouridine(1915)-N(3))-methyltransferase RlmH [Desulfovermiculus sp.]
MHIKIICIGKIKKSYWQAAATTYVQRLRRFCSLDIMELKDGPKHLPSCERMQVEAQAIQAKVSSQDIIICLDSHGRSLTSPQLASQVKSWLEAPGQTPCFVLGGAYGLSAHLIEQSSSVLGLGPLTLPHELARIVLLEQLYRALTIIHNHPYHH